MIPGSMPGSTVWPLVVHCFTIADVRTAFLWLYFRHQEGLELLRRLSQEPASLEVPPRGAAAGMIINI